MRDRVFKSLSRSARPVSNCGIVLAAVSPAVKVGGANF